MDTMFSGFLHAVISNLGECCCSGDIHWQIPLRAFGRSEYLYIYIYILFFFSFTFLSLSSFLPEAVRVRLYAPLGCFTPFSSSPRFAFGFGAPLRACSVSLVLIGRLRNHCFGFWSLRLRFSHVWGVSLRRSLFCHFLCRFLKKSLIAVTNFFFFFFKPLNYLLFVVDVHNIPPCALKWEQEIAFFKSLVSS